MDQIATRQWLRMHGRSAWSATGSSRCDSCRRVSTPRKSRRCCRTIFFLSAISCVVMSACFDEKATFSCAVGAALGALYLYLLQRNVDGVGASTVEEVSKLPPPIVVPVVLVLLVAKNTATLALIPTLAGFLISKLATLTQLAYPDGWGVAETE